MSCDRYRAFWLDEITEREFAAHARGCDACREAAALDERIEREARELPAPTSAPGLWPDIEARLRAEGASTRTGADKPAGIIRGLFAPRRHNAFRYAATILLAAGVSYLAFFWPGSREQAPRDLLTNQALARVEAVEQEYVDAIRQLEQVAEPMLAGADTKLLLLYRERLETIDAQIARCQEALSTDRGNAHIRRYLLAAFQDKQDALTELLTLAQG